MDSETSQKGPSSVRMYRSCLVTAGVAGVFCVVIAAVMLINFGQRKISDTRLEAQLEAMKQEIRESPGDTQLVAEYRALDTQFRYGRMHRLGVSNYGAWLLLGSIIVLVGMLKLADSARKKLPMPEGGSDVQQKQLSDADFARRGVVIGLVVLGLGTVFLALFPRIDYAGTDSEGGQAETWPSDEEIAQNWPCFRGPNGAGISHFTNIPDKWDGASGEGIVWKSPIPLAGHNSPVVWGDRVFLAAGEDNKLEVYGFDANSGKLLWTGQVPMTLPADGEELQIMEDTGLAAPTMVTDGKRACAIFASGDMGCFDRDGKRLWVKSLGIPDSIYGYASSLAIYRNLVIVQFDEGMAEDGKSRLIAINIANGQIAWETRRPVGNSWSSPIVTTVDGVDQIITCADPWVIAYEAATGIEIWRAECLSGDVCPSPVYADGRVYVIEPYTRVVTIRTGGRGNVTETHVDWDADEFGPDVCCPLSTGEWVLLLDSAGTMATYKAEDGSKFWEEEIDADFMASPSLVGDKLYLLARKGTMFIAQGGQEYKLLGKCELGENCYATPAFVDGRIYIRGEKNLYCIGKAE